MDPSAATGAGGFVGKAVCRRLVAAGEAVVGIDSPGAAARVQGPGAAETQHPRPARGRHGAPGASARDAGLLST